MSASRLGLGHRVARLGLAVCLLALGCSAQDSRAKGAIAAGDQAVRQHAFREALNQYRLATTAVPLSFEAQTRRGAIAEVLGEFDEALEAYSRAARLAPSAIGYYRAGAIAERMGNTALSIEYLGASIALPSSRGERTARTGLRWIERLSAGFGSSRVARLLPDWVSQSLNAGRFLLGNAVVDRDAVAGALFAALVENDEPARALELARARGWVEEGVDYCAAAPGPASSRISSETRALVGMLAAPEGADCLLAVGRSLADAGLVRLSRLVLMDRIHSSADPRVRQEAETFLRYRLPAHEVPKLAESFNIVGYNLQHRYKDLDTAVAAYQRAIAVDARFSWPYANLGRLYMDLEQNELALDWLRAAVRVNPNHFRAQVNLGVTLRMLERYEEAIPAYRAALSLNPEDALVHANLGRTLLKVGQDSEGLRELQIAVRLDPNLTKEREFLNWRLGSDPRGGRTPFGTR